MINSDPLPRKLHPCFALGKPYPAPLDFPRQTPRPLVSEGRAISTETRTQQAHSSKEWPSRGGHDVYPSRRLISASGHLLHRWDCPRPVNDRGWIFVRPIHPYIRMNLPEGVGSQFDSLSVPGDWF
jgi:hypothetical protein